MKLHRHQRHGFTIVEIMLVVSIIGILAVIAIPKVVNAVNKARISQAQTDLDFISAAINQLTADTGKWPATDAWLDNDASHYGYDIRNQGANWIEVPDLSTPEAGLLSSRTNFFGSRWQGPYLEKLPIDPWGHQYFFDSDYNVGPSNASERAGAVVTGGGGVTGPTFNRVVVGSYGPNGVGANKYDKDDIYVILK